jgi:hypothetical protein
MTAIGKGIGKDENHPIKCSFLADVIIPIFGLNGGNHPLAEGAFLRVLRMKRALEGVLWLRLLWGSLKKGV